MKKYTIRDKIGPRSFKLLAKLVEGEFSDTFIYFMSKFAGVSLEEDTFINARTGNKWVVSAYETFKTMHNLIKEFLQAGWGKKVPFAYSPNGWHYCISFDEETYGKIIVNRWTDHSPEDQFIVIADSFEDFINGLEEKTKEII